MKKLFLLLPLICLINCKAQKALSLGIKDTTTFGLEVKEGYYFVAEDNRKLDIVFIDYQTYNTNYGKIHVQQFYLRPKEYGSTTMHFAYYKLFDSIKLADITQRFLIKH